MAANPVGPIPDLHIQTETRPEETLVRCAGKITLETAPIFDAAIKPLLPNCKCLVVDLTDVTRIDSAGLGVLTSLWSHMRKQSAELDVVWPASHAPSSHRELKLMNPSEPLRKLFRLTRLDKVFHISDTGGRE